MALILLFPLFLISRFSFIDITEAQRAIWLFFLMVPVGCLWFVTCVAETNRAPFDFAEGESELVSGFNIEYGRAGFALIFLAEYARILIIGLFSSVLFLGGTQFFLVRRDLVLVLKVFGFAFLFI